jgi:hypothetical protein
MSQEFMFYVRNTTGDEKAKLSAEDHLTFVRQCETYISKLKAGGHLIAAQPISLEGCTLMKRSEDWHTHAIDANGEVQVGYYHILARDMEEAISIAKENPEFEWCNASIEIRRVKTSEAQTKYVYPR